MSEKKSVFNWTFSQLLYSRKTQLYKNSLLQHFDIPLLGLRLASPNINRTAHIRHQHMKTTVLSCHIFLISSGVEKMNNI